MKTLVKSLFLTLLICLFFDSERAEAQQKMINAGRQGRRLTNTQSYSDVLRWTNPDNFKNGRGRIEGYEVKDRKVGLLAPKKSPKRKQQKYNPYDEEDGYDSRFFEETPQAATTESEPDPWL